MVLIDVVEVDFCDRFENKILICLFTSFQVLDSQLDCSFQVGSSRKFLNFVFQPL